MAQTPSDNRIALWLAVCFVLLYGLAGHGSFSGSDEVAVFETTEALWERGETAIDPGPHVFRGRAERFYGHFAPGQSLLGLPFFALGDWLDKGLPESVRRALASWEPPGEGPAFKGSGRVQIFTTLLYPPLISGLLIGIFFQLSRALGTSRRNALLVSVLLGLTSYVALLSTYYLRHTTEAVLILGSLLALVRHAKSGSAASLCTASVLASAILLVRIPALLALPGLVVYGFVALQRGRRARAVPLSSARAGAALLGPAIAALALHTAYNFYRWGTWLESPMLDQAAHFDTPLYVGLWGFLLSPGASIFVYSPLLLLLPWTLPGFWREKRAECVAVVLIALCFLLVSARFQIWTGLWSAPGPRYLFVLTPLLFLPMGRWLDRGPSGPRWCAVWSLAFTGLLVQALQIAVSWPATVQLMNYKAFPHPMEFVFVPEQHPLFGALALIQTGRLDAWVWHLGRGWPGREPEFVLAALIVLGWAVLFGIALAGLRRALSGGVSSAALESSDKPG